MIRIKRVKPKHVGDDDAPLVYTIVADNDDKNQVLDFRTAMKKPVPIQVCQMPCDFEVETLEDTLKGKKNDWLMHGVVGEYYPCDNNVFQLSYDLQD